VILENDAQKSDSSASTAKRKAFGKEKGERKTLVAIQSQASFKESTRLTQ
jgi:hypothetical protein